MVATVNVGQEVEEEGEEEWNEITVECQGTRKEPSNTNEQRHLDQNDWTALTMKMRPIE